MSDFYYISFVRFSIQLLICFFAYLIPRKRKQKFLIRLVHALLFYFLLGSGVHALLHRLPGQNTLVYTLFYMTLTGIMSFSFTQCFDTSILEMVFIGTCAYATEHIIFAVTRAIQFLLGDWSHHLPAVPDYLLFRFLNYIFGALLVYTLVVRRNAPRERFRKRDIRLIWLAIVVMTAAVMLSVMYTYAPVVGEGAALLTHFVCPAYSTLCCLLVIVMEYYVFRENRLEEEKESMEKLLQMAESQRRSSKEAIDIINMRCHDLKHQMKALLRDEADEEKRDYIESIRSAVNLYEATYRTGNEALDYVLREKTLLADEYKIDFTCMADGKALSGMQSVDIYALMGNALDNAIEHTAQEEESRRFIRLTIRRKANMTLIRLENTCTTQLAFSDGLPVTTKENPQDHGFGVRSIQYVAEKYGGEVIMRLTNDVYHLDVMLPMNKAA